MANQDFDVQSLAAYLHLDPAAVAKLADRGKIPGRKVGGRWVFARPDIHRWLEDRIGLSDEEQLQEMEHVLRNPPAESMLEEIHIAELLRVDAIAIPLTARTRDSVIREMVELASRTGWVWDPVKLAEAVRQREELHSTALDNGVAFLHPRRPMPSILGEAFLSLGITAGGIPFGGDRGALTDIFFLICSTDDRTHLRVLARLSRLVSDTELLSALRAATEPREAWELIGQAERRLSS